MNDFHSQVLRQSSPEAGDVSCGQITLQVADPVYGSRLVNNLEYFLPPFFLITIFFVTMAETVWTLIHTIREVFHIPFAFHGVKFHDSLISCFFELLCVLSVHVALALVLFSFSIWNDLLPMEGTFTPVIALIFMEGLCGIVAGLSSFSIHYFLVWAVRDLHWLNYATLGTPFCYLIGEYQLYLC